METAGVGEDVGMPAGMDVDVDAVMLSGIVAVRGVEGIGAVQAVSSKDRTSRAEKINR